MSFEVRNLTLSALSPVKFTYSYNATEKLKSDYRVMDTGIRYYKQNLLDDCADGAFSQHNAVILTEIKDLKSVFENVVEEQTIKTIGASFYLSVSDTDYLAGDYVITNTNSDFFVGGRGSHVIFNALPIETGVIELKYHNKQIAVASTYPYDFQLLAEPLQEDISRQRFDVEIYGNKIAIKTKTPEGFRYLSYGVDRKLRFVGVHLNETTINEYLFTPIFISSSLLKHNFDPTLKEVRYYNESQTTGLNRTLTIKDETNVDTSLLVSCALKDITSKDEVNANIAITKTNFTTSGTFNTSL